MKSIFFTFGCILLSLSSCRFSDSSSLPAVAETNVSSVMINPADQVVLEFVPEGSFSMGASPIQSMAICQQWRADCALTDFEDETPVHDVWLDAFWIYKTEVSNAMYRKCVDARACDLPAFTDFYNNPIFDDHPVVYVSWYAAENYCVWAGGHLPAEAQWEKAARGTDGRMFPWGAEVSCEQANLKGCSQPMTMPVGSLPEGASPYGVLDMAGNVSEWVADWYNSDYYSLSPAINPGGPDSGEMKVIRGGSWKNPGVGLRSTNRGANYPEIFSTGVGFRCVIGPGD